MKLCDAHIHLGESGPWQPYLRPAIYVEELMKLLDKFSVERAVVFPNPLVGDKYPSVNNYIAENVRKHPDRLVGFGRVDPRRGEEAISEVARFKQLGLSGLKLHPIVECFRPDHPFFDPFFRKVNDLNLTTLIHTGNSRFASPGLVSRVAQKYADFTLILGHLSEGCLNVMEKLENVYVETSGTIPQLVELSADIDEDRVLFGSDVPYFKYPTQLAVVESAQISNAARRKILYENFQTLFAAR